MGTLVARSPRHDPVIVVQPALPGWNSAPPPPSLPGRRCRCQDEELRTERRLSQGSQGVKTVDEHGNERAARQPAAALGLSLADDLGGPESPRNQGFVLVLPEALVRPDVLAAAAAGLEIHERGLAMLLREKSGRVGGEVGDEDLVLRVVVAEQRVRPVGRAEAVARREPGRT